MAAKTATRAVVEEQVETVDVEAIKESIAQHQAAAKALRNSLKALKQSGTPLERVEARQEHDNKRLGMLLASKFRARLAAKQPREGAIEAIVALCRRLLTEMPETVEASEEAEDGLDG